LAFKFDFLNWNFIFYLFFLVILMISLEQMLSSSVHLGHQVQQWNPKMGPYIYGERNGIHIIDLLQTLVCLENACTFLSNASKSNKK
jgi:small subunit ribosomal protein S2